jgi:Orsellinic acid/F9775 biosynthesis cluster protein D
MYDKLRLTVEIESEQDMTTSSEGEEMDMTLQDGLKAAPITIDDLYNVIVCEECRFGLPFEWTTNHLRDRHGLKMDQETIKRDLNIEHDPMTVEEAKDWIKNFGQGRAIQGIPVVHGLRCTECEYSTGTMKVMVNHFVKNHEGLKASEHSEKCKVQLVFKSWLHKYIQVKESEEMEVDEIREPDWVVAVNREFDDSRANVKVATDKGKTNLRLMNIFIAKTRWDVLVKDMDLEVLVEMSSMPTIRVPLHKIILCGRRYIHKACEELDKGSIIVKRLIMSGR